MDWSDCPLSTAKVKLHPSTAALSIHWQAIGHQRGRFRWSMLASWQVAVSKTNHSFTKTPLAISASVDENVLF
jgi:hypothetical protein